MRTLDASPMCARGCTYTDDEGLQWGKEARHGYLCGSCFWRIRYRLAEAPKIVVALRTTMVPIRAGSLDGKIDGTRDRSLPFMESSAPDADELFAFLVNTAAFFAEKIGGRAAVTLPESVWPVFADGGDARGLPAGLGVTEAAARTEAVAGWLTGWGRQIASLKPSVAADMVGEGHTAPHALPPVVNYHNDVIDQIRTYRARAGLVQPRLRTRARHACPVCLTSTVEVSSPDVGPTLVRCTNCHQTFDPTKALAELEEVAA